MARRGLGLGSSSPRDKGSYTYLCSLEFQILFGKREGRDAFPFIFSILVPSRMFFESTVQFVSNCLDPVSSDR
jgi:hypothetical protein